ncbi:hypothetical protein SAMN05216184_10998 [Georgenia satyanarayanai]|uniref:Uncharacterized protein n=1 Tax=Georgenia satyanarayanai TaxID=860221 RepID=A0A2Y9AJ04_9MICO|nr:hypothetical protein [Georgenia satyanarayanai]PYF99074.1 hypothetical protein A8987_10998 [Georgenia satyanarayanai]SSA44036.1 hypothetical protein SAMN05216184_10998 [Georgenia satyanarayanai]
MTEDFTRPAGDPQALGQEPGAPGRPPVGPPPPVAPPAPVTPPPPGAPAPVSTGAAHQAQHDEGGGAKEAAKQEASKVAGSAKEQAANVAGTAKDEARQAAGEAKRQAQQLYRQGTSELSSQAGTQQQRLASGLRSFSSEMNQMADGSEEPGVATNVARWASQAADDAGRWLEDREPTELLEEVGRYARRHPGTFMVIAAGLGLAAGRIARSLKDMGDDDGTSGTSTGGSAGLSGSGRPGTTGTTTAPVGYSTGTTPLSGTATPPPPTQTYGTDSSTSTRGDQPGGLR